VGGGVRVALEQAGHLLVLAKMLQRLGEMGMGMGMWMGVWIGVQGRVRRRIHVHHFLPFLLRCVVKRLVFHLKSYTQYKACTIKR